MREQERLAEETRGNLRRWLDSCPWSLTRQEREELSAETEPIINDWLEQINFRERLIHDLKEKSLAYQQGFEDGCRKATQACLTVLAEFQTRLVQGDRLLDGIRLCLEAVRGPQGQNEVQP